MDRVFTNVGLVRCPDYEPQILLQAFQQLTEACPVKLNLRSADVVLKPNLISARKNSLACTEGRFIQAAATWFLDHGARVTVGDSPAFGTSRTVLAKINILHTLRGMGIRITDFMETEPVVLPSGLKTGLARDALNSDLLVNLPRVKAHAQLRVTLAVKNYFGCVVGMRKPMWHMRYGGRKGCFTRYLVEILSMLPPSMTFVDGITAMHRTGPIGGEPFQLAVVACSENPVALDRVMLEILDVAPHASPLLQACMAAGLTGTDIENIVFPLCHPLELKTWDFQVPEKLNPIRFNPARFVYNNIRRCLLRQKIFH